MPRLPPPPRAPQRERRKKLYRETERESEDFKMKTTRKEEAKKAFWESIGFPILFLLNWKSL